MLSVIYFSEAALFWRR